VLNINTMTQYSRLRILASILVPALSVSVAAQVAAEEVKYGVVITEQAPQSEEAEGVVFTIVEQMPQYPGGQDGMMRYLGGNIKYPEEASEAGIEGVVYVTFVVEKDGAVGEARVLRGIGGGCDEEAVRVVRAMPKWEPGMQRGKPVRVQYNLPIRYKLNKAEKKN
jgi:TonB family protein